MGDFYLKFADPASAAVALASAGIDAAETAGWSMDVLGTVWADPVSEGLPSVARVGWHVNLRIRSGELPTALVPFRVTPSTPYRRFA